MHAYSWRSVSMHTAGARAAGIECLTFKDEIKEEDNTLKKAEAEIPM